MRGRWALAVSDAVQRTTTGQLERENVGGAEDKTLQTGVWVGLWAFVWARCYPVLLYT